MKYTGLVFIVLVAAALLTIVVGIVVALTRRMTGISKDYAESIAMRRHSQGQVIGARFTRIGKKWIWEFDVREGTSIYRIWVDARAAAIVRTVSLSPSEQYARGPGQPLGRRID